MPDEAVPFAASAVLVLFGAIASYIVGKRVPSVVRELNENYSHRPKVPPHLTPDGVGRISIWASDCAQAGLALVAPAVAALIAVEDKVSAIGLVYLTVGALGAFLFARLLHASPDRYVRRLWFGLSPVNTLAVVVNIVMAVVVSVAT